MSQDSKQGGGQLAEILRRWKKFLIILLPCVLVAGILGLAFGNPWIPGVMIPILLAPLVVALLFRNVKVPKSSWHLLYHGPLENGRVVREALRKTGIRSWDPSDNDMGSRTGSGGHLESAVHVDLGKAEEASKILQRVMGEHPELFREPKAEV